MSEITEIEFNNRIFTLVTDMVMLFPSNNEVHIAKSLLTEPDFKLHDPKNGDWIAKGFGLIDGKHTITEIVNAAPLSRQKEFRSILLMLQKHYLIEMNKPSEPFVSAFLKQRLAKNSTAVSSYHDNLVNKSVTIVGSGTFSAELIRTIRHFPIGTINWIAPNGDQESKHKNDQNYESTVCKEVIKKAELREKLLALNSDFIVVAEDFFDIDSILTVDDVASLTNNKWLFSFIEGWNIDIGPCFVPDESGGFRCWLQNTKRYQPLVDLNTKQKQLIEKYQKNALNPAFVNIATGLIANELSDLLGILPTNISKNLTLSLSKQSQFDMSAFEQKVVYTEKCHQCESCLNTALTKVS